MKILLPLIIVGALTAFAMANYAYGDRKELAEELTKLTQNLSCDSNQQCKSYGYGNRPCGGHAAYKLYSTKTTDEAKLLPMAERYAALDKLYNEVNGMGSICSIEMPLKTACVSNQCTEVQEQF